MKWSVLTKEESREIYEKYVSSGTVGDIDQECPEEYKELRNKMTTIFSEVLSDIGIGPESISKGNNSYKVDCLFGLKLYMLLSSGKYRMTVRDASTDGYWRYISMKVVPDIIEMRYGLDHPDRYWKKGRRLWFRVLWWYIYLSWQGNEEDTYEVIKDNSTDEILQLVDRVGKGGYRVNLYRAMMKKYSTVPQKERTELKIFRKVMVLNTARVQVVEPELVDGGVNQYIDDLYSVFEEED